jgi:putative Holliday junction resolvase
VAVDAVLAGADPGGVGVASQVGPPFLAVDPGEARIGLAVSDPGGTIARPLRILRHRSRTSDAERILSEARACGSAAIVVGLALDEEGRQGPQARRAQRLVEALKARADIPILTWDESFSTEQALQLRSPTAVDARAAAVFLQDFLDHLRDQA